MMHVIYRITNKINNKHYVGQSSRIRDRWSAHKNLANKVLGGARLGHFGIQLIHLKIAEYGIGNFEFVMLEECENQDIANEKEYYLVIKYSSLVPNGYNVMPGGKVVSGPDHPNYGKILSEEHKKKIARSNIGKTHTKETRQKLRDANLGKAMPLEVKRKVSFSKKGTKPWNIGHKLSDEHKEKISKTKKGNSPAWNKGKHFSLQSRIKMSKSQLNNNNALKLTKDQADEIREKYASGEYGSLKELGQEYNVSKQTVSRIVKNKTYTDVR